MVMNIQRPDLENRKQQKKKDSDGERGGDSEENGFEGPS